MYLSCGTRPVTAFVVKQLSKRNVDPRIGHLKAAKQVIYYLKDIIHLGLKYRGTFESNRQINVLVTFLFYGLVGYMDSNYAGDSEDCKFVISNCFYMNGVIVS